MYIYIYIYIDVLGYQQQQQQPAYTQPPATAPTASTRPNLPVPPARNTQSTAPSQTKARALFDFNAQESNELSFR